MSEVLEQTDVAADTGEVVQPQEEVANAPEQEKAPEKAPEPQEEVQERNWRATRARLEQQAREVREERARREELERELTELRKGNKPPPQKDEVEESLLTDSEKALYREIKGLKDEIKRSKVRETDVVVDRLKARFPDFDEVMDPENIAYLQTNNAALAKALASLKDDPYEQGMAAYDALRRTDWYQQRHTMKDKAKIDENQKKPMSVQAVRKTGALSEANQFQSGSPEHKKALYKEMQEARKRA